MTCPKCQAKLLRMPTEYFCLQCGRSVPLGSIDDHEVPKLEQTTDPVLRRAIMDVSKRPVTFEQSENAETPEPSPKPTVVAATPTARMAEEAARIVSPVAPVMSDLARPAPRDANQLHRPRIEPRSSVVGTSVPATQPVAPAERRPTNYVLAMAGTLRRLARLAWWRRVERRTALGLAGVLVLFVATNIALGLYFSNHVYPGVQVAGLGFGGRPWAGLPASVAKALPSQPVDLVVGSTHYALTPAELGATYQLEAMTKLAEERGHTTLPLLGLFQTIWSAPIPAEYEIDGRTLEARLATITNEASHPATAARPIVVAGTALVLPDKSGQSIDGAKLREAVLIALANHQQVVVSTTAVTPTVSAEAYKTDVAQAQAQLGLSLSVKIKTTTVNVPATQIGGWLRFGSPGAGTVVDGAAVAAYVNSLGTGFDRKAASTALITAVAGVKPLAYTASTRRVTTAKLAAATVSAPEAFRYCLAADNDAALAELAAGARTAYAATDGWALGGTLAFAPAATGCSYTLWLVASDAMTRFSPACAKQSTCRVGNDIVINRSNWDKPPNTWQGSRDDYRRELINHETGHWLGFDHLSCRSTSTTAPIQDVVVNVAGCSPRWFPLSADLAPVKILPGF